MTTQAMGFVAPAQLAISEKAQSPDPGIPGVMIWSSSENKLLQWDGASWSAVRSSFDDDVCIVETRAAPGSNAPCNLGIGLATPSGSRSSVSSSASSIGASFPMVGVTGASTPGTVVAELGTSRCSFRARGFTARFRFRFSNVSANGRWFVGLTNATAQVGNVSIANGGMQNIVGLGWDIDSGGNNALIYSNDTSATADAIDLGSSFAARASGLAYEFRLWCAAGAAAVKYAVRRIDAAAEVTGSVSTKLPSSTSFLSPMLWLTNNTDTFGLNLQWSSIVLGTPAK